MDLLIWGILSLALAVTELLTMQLVSIWFAGGALAAFIAAIFDAGTTTQLILFVGVSVLLLAITRPLLKKLMVSKIEQTNAGREIGQTAVVIEEIDAKRGTGRVRCNGVDWTAVTQSERIIPADTTVLIREVQGAKLLVEAEPTPAKQPVTK